MRLSAWHGIAKLRVVQTLRQLTPARIGEQQNGMSDHKNRGLWAEAIMNVVRWSEGVAEGAFVQRKSFLV